MRVRNVGQHVYIDMLKQQPSMTGGSFPVYKGKRRPMGGGRIRLSNIGKMLGKFAKKTIKPVGKRIGSSLVRAAKEKLPEIAMKHGADFLAGKKPTSILKAALKETGKEALGSTRKAIEAELDRAMPKKKKKKGGQKGAGLASGRKKGVKRRKR